jgi:thiol-disulfide isomerase/thioredoxin
MGRSSRNPLAALGFVLFLPAFATASSAEEPGLHEYVLTDFDGKETTLAAYRGRILVVEFFATWCAPCRKDLPEISSLQEKFPPEQVAFVAVSADPTSGTAERVPAYVREMGLKIPVFLGSPIFVDRFAGIQERTGRQILLPHTYIFDGEGEIAYRAVGEQRTKKRHVEAELERLLKERTGG